MFALAVSFDDRWCPKVLNKVQVWTSRAGRGSFPTGVLLIKSCTTRVRCGLTLSSLILISMITMIMMALVDEGDCQNRAYHLQQNVPVLILCITVALTCNCDKIQLTVVGNSLVTLLIHRHTDSSLQYFVQHMQILGCRYTCIRPSVVCNKRRFSHVQWNFL